MSARVVANLLALAHQGHVLARRAGNPALEAEAALVAARALEHPDAGVFFGALALALDELDDAFGNDPEVQDNGDGVLTPDLGPKDADADSVGDDARQGDEDQQDKEARDASGGDAAGPVHEGVSHPDAAPSDAGDGDGSESDEGESRVTAAARSVARVLRRMR